MIPAVIDDLVATLRAAGCVFAEDEARLLLQAARTPSELAPLVRRRVAGEPLEQVLGWVEFHGLRVAVEPGVFVPRRRTELLVDEAVRAARAPGHGEPPVVVDVCCGSGAVAVAVAADLGEVDLHAADVDPAAVACARRNLAGLGAVHLGDLLSPLPAGLRGRVDVVAACTPYVPTGELRLMPPEAREHEPRTALDGGHDGLDVVRRLAHDVTLWLRPGGYLVVETSGRQGAVAAQVFGAAGLAPRVVADDERGGTVVAGRLAAGAGGG